jgi:hypothetical protein
MRTSRISDAFRGSKSSPPARSGFAATAAAMIAFAAGATLGLDSPPEIIFLGEAAVMLIGTACGAVAALTLVTLCAARWGGLAGHGAARRRIMDRSNRGAGAGAALSPGLGLQGMRKSTVMQDDELHPAS